MANLQIADMQTAVSIFFNSPELGNAEIMKLFNCSRSAALRLKRRVQDEQDRQGIKTFSSRGVNTRLAYSVWGLDIKDLEQRLLKYHKLQQRGLFSNGEGLYANNRSTA